MRLLASSLGISIDICIYVSIGNNMYIMTLMCNKSQKLFFSEWLSL